MDKETERLIELLEKYYGNDQASMQTLATLKRTPAVVRQYEVLRENPIVIKIAGEIIPKLEVAYEKLTGINAYTLDDMERAMHLCTIAWGEWFLKALGEDPEKRIESVQNHVKLLAERAGILSKG
jgi:hypothetical protein